MPHESSIKAVFLDVRDALGEGGHPDPFMPYLPSTRQLLSCLRQNCTRLGAITTIQPGSNRKDTVHAIRGALLAEESTTSVRLTIGDFLSDKDIITDEEADAHLDSMHFYQFAARRFQLEPHECVLVSAITTYCVAAKIAGMEVLEKPCPPGREFLPALVGKIGQSAVDSGWQFQAMLEHEHMLGERIFACGDRIAQWISKLLAGWTPQLDKLEWISPPKIEMPPALEKAMASFIFLIDNFADQVHLRAEEAMLHVAVACGMPTGAGQWVFDQHEQARAYWACLDVAWRRIKQGDDDDRWFALRDFQMSVEAFVFLFKAHAIRENYSTYTEAGKAFTDSDDAMVMNLIRHTGPSDITPYVGVVERMETQLKSLP